MVTQQEQAVSEEQKIAKAVAESEAKQAQQQLEEDEKKAAMLKSISVHRELMVSQTEHVTSSVFPLSPIFLNVVPFFPPN